MARRKAPAEPVVEDQAPVGDAEQEQPPAEPEPRPRGLGADRRQRYREG